MLLSSISRCHRYLLVGIAEVARLPINFIPADDQTDVESASSALAHMRITLSVSSIRAVSFVEHTNLMNRATLSPFVMPMN
ncbi:MAG: hypothetical protein ACR5LF_00280 [Symbiopectobacterium sp.]